MCDQPAVSTASLSPSRSLGPASLPSPSPPPTPLPGSNTLSTWGCPSPIWGSIPCTGLCPRRYPALLAQLCHLGGFGFLPASLVGTDASWQRLTWGLGPPLFRPEGEGQERNRKGLGQEEEDSGYALDGRDCGRRRHVFGFLLEVSCAPLLAPFLLSLFCLLFPNQISKKSFSGIWDFFLRDSRFP